MGSGIGWREEVNKGIRESGRLRKGIREKRVVRQIGKRGMRMGGREVMKVHMEEREKKKGIEGQDRGRERRKE